MKGRFAPPVDSGSQIVSTAVERIVNLALFLADAREPVTAERIRTEVWGYPEDQDDAAFLRMFERDKKDLVRMGFFVIADTEGRYLLDRASSFASAIEFDPAEAAAVRVAARAMLDDPSFPFGGDLRLAVTKISAELGTDLSTHTLARLADEDPKHQGATVAALTQAAENRKRVTMGYTNSMGAASPHEIEPYGIFLHDGRWYLVGRDVAIDEIRTYAVARMSEIKPNGSKPESPDFERPTDFDIGRFVRLPFQFGSEAPFVATLEFEPPVAWKASRLAGGRGTIVTRPDGSVSWEIDATSADDLLRFVVEHGPGVHVSGPPELRERLREGLSRVVALHA